MVIPITNTAAQTLIFLALLVPAMLLSLWPRKSSGLFPVSVTNELKGLAILSIIVAHVGYYLVSDNRFLSPWSQFAGIGVNLFLLLSGYGLTASSIKKTLSIGSFYAKRLLKLFIPLWITLAVYLILDVLFLHKTYPLKEIIQAFFGLYPAADLYNNINSPLWYFTLILFYYLVYPLVYIKRAPAVSALVLYAITRVIIGELHLPVTLGVYSLYQLHLLAFPLGMVGAWLVSEAEKKQWLQKIPVRAALVLRWAVALGAVLVGYYFAVHGNVGHTPVAEERASIVALLGFTIAAACLWVESKFLVLLGAYSYELYLLHWPIMYRYDFLFKILPVGVALFVYLFVLVGLGYVLRYVAGRCEALIVRK